jgi:hypothetical protein
LHGIAPGVARGEFADVVVVVLAAVVAVVDDVVIARVAKRGGLSDAQAPARSSRTIKMRRTAI